MQSKLTSCVFLILILCVACHMGQPSPGRAQTANGESVAVQLGDGSTVLTAPKKWIRKQPRSQIVEHEFAYPAVDEDPSDGRIIIMPSGGTVDANIERWIGQFTQPNGSVTKEKAKVEKRKIAELDVHLVDLSGTYRDQPRGPFGPKVDRSGYRMLGAIIETPKLGRYYVKFYGPEKTVSAGEKSFLEFVQSLRIP